jgi:hypothetical protein
VKFSVSKNLLVMAGILAAPVTTVRMEHAAPTSPVPPRQDIVKPADPRTVRLQRFFSKLHCPIKNMAEDFIRVADDNNLDWRLLPSISIVESSGGKTFKNNNILGWANGDRSFPTIRAGIAEVAFKLGKSALYRRRDTEAKLRLYNPNDDYAGKVEEIMQRISPVRDLKLIASERRLGYAGAVSND